MPFEMAWSLSVIRVHKPETQTLYDYSVWPMLKLVNRIVLLLLLTGHCIVAVCQDQEISRASLSVMTVIVAESFLLKSFAGDHRGHATIYYRPSTLSTAFVSA